MEAYIYDAVRTVRGKGNKKGALVGVTPTELATQCLHELKDKHEGVASEVEDVILGWGTQVMDQFSPHFLWSLNKKKNYRRR